MKSQFHARGKLLLTSEFMILHGAKALAVPLVKGQSLSLKSKSNPAEFSWIAMYNNSIWFEATYDLRALSILESSDQEKATTLLRMLNELIELNPEFRKKMEQHDVVTNLDFDPGYGFGSSSTLTALLAEWAGVDPMQLHFSISKGSGYDVACSSANSAILYQVINEMPVIESVDFEPPFIDQLWLIYLGKKQDSSGSVATFLHEYQPQDADIQLFSSFTCDFLRAETLHQFGEIIESHEQRLSEILNQPFLKEKRFNDLQGFVKSLGAWGGDFALIATSQDKESLKKYLSAKDIDVLIPYKELVYQS